MAPLVSMLARAVRRTSAGCSLVLLPASTAVYRSAVAATICNDSIRRLRPIFPGEPDDDEPEFVADEKDVESDEALCGLYHCWCEHFKIKRDPDEMERRFDAFKTCVQNVHQVNNSDLPYTLAINRRADTPIPEGKRTLHPVVEERYLRHRALGGLTITWGPEED
ncbi:hypothetical protein BS78_04G159400 [Paspalum vaginatum]|nr:hypothetical protein BS78_04G159400 [Paspalum vaginatum]